MSEQENGPENALGKAASAYLRSARHQPIEWNEWGAAAFEKATLENKPVLLDIGAVWCHWCHVMDRESYESPATAAIINEKFVAVKVDRDERPDVDSRYQAAVSAISGQGGWPLTAFLTPDGKPYFGGTYFPPDERYGRPSFQRVLLTMADAFANKRDEVEESAGSVLRAIEHNESFSGRGGDLGEPLLGKLIESAVKQFDERNGGFGSQPKFPHPGALDLLIDAASRGDVAAKHVATVTLEKMAAGGIYDQLAGGFHRYSVDERWIVPHFEKMAYDNSELLKNYAHAFQSFVEPEFARVARDILRWMDEWLSDRERGGFYASQDADDSLDDDGDYFTWTRDEAAAVLTAEEFEIAAAFYDIQPVGDMHHNPAKNVLRRVTTVAELAAAQKKEAAAVAAVLESAKQKMYAARLQRKTPYVDKTVYTGWNGMCIAALPAGGACAGVEGASGVCAEVFGSRAGGGVERDCGTGSRRRVWRGSGSSADCGRAGGLCVRRQCCAGCVGGDRGTEVLLRSPTDRRCHADALLRLRRGRRDEPRLLRHGARSHGDWGAKRAAQAAAGLAYAGRECDRSDLVASTT
jgi:uncharacterized protein YyaL (SSP411 family)